MVIKTITQPNGMSMLVINYRDEHGNATQIIHQNDDETMALVTDLVNGKIDESQLISALTANDNFVDNVSQTVNRALKRVSAHLTSDGLHVYFDNDTFNAVQLDETLEDHLVTLLQNEADEAEWTAWARFTERLYTNVHDDIRARLFAWLKSQGWMTLDEDGRLVGYRGCAIGADEVPYSKHSGYAIVDGKPLNGPVPNEVGSVVEMPRSMVAHDPACGCASGLHVGTLAYAKSWAGPDAYLLRVAVAPEDIVSVPYECDSQKIRCCRFEVLSKERTESLDESEYAFRTMFFANLNLNDDFDDFDEDNEDENENVFDEDEFSVFPW